MGLLGIFKKKDKDEINKKELLDLPCDYSGYDMVFEQGVTEPKLYGEFNNIITNSKLSIKDISGYDDLTKDTDEDTFSSFYSAWINKLLKNHFAVLLDNNVKIRDFATSINKILSARGETFGVNVDEIVERYSNELKDYTFNGVPVTEELNYDVLEANIIASELRKNGYELICLFDGYDNTIKTIIRIEDIDKAKNIEERI